jgi:phage shock protein PspC (stress-responsive transcriptional regulator)
MAKEETGARKFFRSRKNRMVAGVCGGIGEYFCVDPLLVRLLFVVFLGPALLFYVLAWLLAPEGQG